MNERFDEEELALVLKFNFSIHCWLSWLYKLKGYGTYFLEVLKFPNKRLLQKTYGTTAFTHEMLMFEISNDAEKVNKSNSCANKNETSSSIARKNWLWWHP